MGEFQESLVVPGDEFLGTVGSEPKSLEMDEMPPREFSGFLSGKPSWCVCVGSSWLCLYTPVTCEVVCSSWEKAWRKLCSHKPVVLSNCCSSLMDGHNGSSCLCPGLNRVGIPHLASILSAYAQSRSPHLLHGCVLLFRAMLQIQESESRE